MTARDNMGCFFGRQSWMALDGKTGTQSFEVLAKTATALLQAIPGNREHKWRGALAATVVLGACALWFAVLCRLGASMDALPWYITVGLIGVICSHRATCKALALSCLSLPLNSFQSREPVSLLESFALTYLLASLGLYVFVACQASVTRQQPARMTRFVDIQLVSPLDYADRQSPLAGTRKQVDLHKRRSDSQTQQGSQSVQKAAVPSKTSQLKPTAAKDTATADKQPSQALAARQQRLPMKQLKSDVHSREGRLPSIDDSLDAQDMILVKPASESPPVPAAAKQPPRPQPKQASNRPYLEEVQPPELVEMIENDGAAASANVFEAGGSSAGGTGAANDLNAYIKALHQRIKNLWSPPRGQPHKAAILFRIKAQGQLAFIKLVSSSSDPPTDEAALRAISGAVNGHPLPPDSHLPYLDVQYTFNYRVDELHEVDQ